MKNWYAKEGAPHPLGVTYIKAEDAYNFALYSKTAVSVKLLLYKEDNEEEPIAAFQLDPSKNKSQRVWHCRLKKQELKGAVFYAYQVDGPIGDDPPYWHHFDNQKILLDPYAEEIHFPKNFSRKAAIEPGSNVGKAPLGFIKETKDEFDWQNDQRPYHSHELVIYEMHVRGFTKNANSGVAEDKRGTFAGVIEKIPYLKELGITAVELMPIHQFDPKEKNYWGYMTLNFFAPHNRYSSDQSPGGAIREFKTMVRELHKAGIEVILDVVYNHTTESDITGPNYSYKGIDNSTYYFMNHNRPNAYDNHSGTGNTLRTDHPTVHRLIIDSLRHWVVDMHVDGFRFDLASVFSRRSDGTVGFTPIFADIASEPDLADVRLIAEPWDASSLYQLGRSFPGNTWQQWNGGYRDDLRKFIKSDAGMVAPMIHRVYGSDSLFPDDILNAYRPFQSVNYINSHDGFTLYDMFSYNSKRNGANGHNSTDGHEPNYSWNCGHEGDEHVPQQVMDLRKRQAKNAMTLLMLSNGTPMFLMGDEFLQTQGGNNNPYNQDNETSWLNWNRLHNMKEHFEFVKKLLAFRKGHPTLSRSRFWRDDVEWFGATGAPDYSPASRSFAWYLSGATENDVDLYVMVNAHWEGMPFTIQKGGNWRRVINTFFGPGADFLEEGVEEEITSTSYLVGPRSVVVLVGK